MTSLLGMPNVIAYSAAKAALLGMVRTSATKLGGDGIRVNAIAPDWIESPMLREALDGDPPRQAKILARHKVDSEIPKTLVGRPSIFALGQQISSME
jgi:NAD(P)-dependent dehydrogenase (short-subunit alcohol dehydrogenase family)